MSGGVVRGWCPDAWRPMMAGDGLLVRVQPPLGRLTRAQAIGLCDAAMTHGNGQVDVTRRANLQLRGVRDDDWRALVERLVALGLVDVDPVREARGAIIVAPDWREGDDSHRIATELMARLNELPDLPAKTGFAIDAGIAPILADDPADFRIERAGSDLILRADGHATGVALPRGGEVDALIALSRWFRQSGGIGRMAHHRAPLPDWAAGTLLPNEARPPLRPGGHDHGMALGLPFGRVEASALTSLFDRDVQAIRLTPWRIVIVEDITGGDLLSFITDPASPMMRVDACVGAPACPQASVETRDLARRLAPMVEGRLHLSGCAKGCARGRVADVVLTGRDGRYDLGFGARAGDPPVIAGLDGDQILARFGAA